MFGTSFAVKTARKLLKYKAKSKKKEKNRYKRTNKKTGQKGSRQKNRQIDRQINRRAKSKRKVAQTLQNLLVGVNPFGGEEGEVESARGEWGREYRRANPERWSFAVKQSSLNTQ